MADVIYTGAAPAVAEQKTYTFGGSFSTSDTVTITFPDGAEVVVTVGSTATTAQVATEVFNALTEASLGTGYSVNTSSLPPSFSGSELEDDTSGVITLTGPAGRDLGVTMATSGSGTITPATVRNADGPRFASNTQNFSGGSVATTGDNLILSERDTDISYDLASIDDIDSLEVRRSWGGRLGLPEKNDESGEYYEYSAQFLQLAAATNVTVGTGQGLQGAQMIRLDFNGNGGTIDVIQTGTRKEADIPPLDIKNLTSGTVTIGDGEVSLADCTTCTVTVTGSATVHLSGSITALTVNGNAVVNSEGAVTTLTVTDGTVTCESTVTTANLSNCTATIEGAVTTANLASVVATFEAGVTTANVSSGTVTVQGSGTVGTLNGYGGTIVPDGGITFTTVTLENRAKLDLTSTVQAVTITNPVVMRGAQCAISDPARKVSSLEVDFIGATAKQVDRGMYYTATYSAP